MACRITKKVCKTDGEAKLWGFNYSDFDDSTGAWAWLVRTWKAGTSFVADLVVRPSASTGLQYRSDGGLSGAFEPRWPTTVGATVTDGSITWTAEAKSNDSLFATITNSVWAASDSDIVLSDETIVDTDGDQKTGVNVAGGVAGNTYEVLNRVTFSDGSIEDSLLQVEVN